MFSRKPQDDVTTLDDVINDALSILNNHVVTDPEYAKAVDQLTKLYALKKNNTSSMPSPDTLAIVLGNLIGIIVIVGHERANVVTSKALNFILKATN